jgi:hypothetical protein
MPHTTHEYTNTHTHTHTHTPPLPYTGSLTTDNVPVLMARVRLRDYIRRRTLCAHVLAGKRVRERGEPATFRLLLLLLLLLLYWRLIRKSTRVGIIILYSEFHQLGMVRKRYGSNVLAIPFNLHAQTDTTLRVCTPCSCIPDSAFVIRAVVAMLRWNPTTQTRRK